MSIDDAVGRDPRIGLLAATLGWSRRETLGCLIADVWAICYDQGSALVSERLIDAAAAHQGFAQAMIECELAVRDRSGKIRVSGAKKRIEYIKDKSRAGREGGIKSAKSRQKGPKQNASKPQASRNPNTNTNTNTNTNSNHAAERPPGDPDVLQVLKTKCDDASGTVPEGYRDAVAEFDSKYHAAYSTRPTWGAKQGKLVKDLLRAHGKDEVIRRIGVLFSSPPTWLKPPFDLGTLVQHFDKLVESKTRPGEQIRWIPDLTKRPA